MAWRVGEHLYWNQPENDEAVEVSDAEYRRAAGQNKALFTSDTNEWGTPRHLFDLIHGEFGFDLDVCANAENAKCERFYSKEQNGLALPWAPSRCWMNPPYGREIGRWVARAKIEAVAGALVVGLVPARTDAAWWHENVMRGATEVRLIAGRLCFGRSLTPAPFPSAVVVWRPGPPVTPVFRSVAKDAKWEPAAQGRLPLEDASERDES